jgi:hypothetical protein
MHRPHITSGIHTKQNPASNPEKIPYIQNENEPKVNKTRGRKKYPAPATALPKTNLTHAFITPPFG